MIWVRIPYHLQNLAGLDSRDVKLEIDGDVTQRSILDALEATYPMLKGTIRDRATQERRAFIRFFACEQDLSHVSADEVVPDAVVEGKEPFIVVGAMAGG